MLNTLTRSVPTLSRSPLAPLVVADTYSLISTNSNPFQTKTKRNATANPCQTLHQPHTSHKIGPSATLLSLSSTVNAKNLFCKYKKLN